MQLTTSLPRGKARLKEKVQKWKGRERICQGWVGAVWISQLHLLSGSRVSFSSRYDSSTVVTAIQDTYLCMIGAGTM